VGSNISEVGIGRYLAFIYRTMFFMVMGMQYQEGPILKCGMISMCGIMMSNE
jgi:hypothetical protein